MTSLLLTAGVLVYFAIVAVLLIRRRPWPGRRAAARPERILFPFAAGALSRRALDGALHLAQAEDATLVPVFLARVPLHLPLDAPLPRQAGMAVPLQEAIEQRAAAFAVPVDARIERGRTTRHALSQMLADEPFDRIVLTAAVDGAHGFKPEDIAWVLEHAPGEIVVLRPGTEDPVIRLPDPRRPSRARRSGPADPVVHRPGHGLLSGARGSRG
jgi:hypothetical protein